MNAEEQPNASGPVLPVGPVIHPGCAVHGCGRPREEHREDFMDLRDEVIDHDFAEASPRPYNHEVTPAMITTEWHCHACGAHNDVWGTGADEGYMQCGACGAQSWLVFDPDGFEKRATRTTPAAPGCGSCLTCDPPTRRASGLPTSRMYVCATCGNKRCPAASDCLRWECSGSNDPDQIPQPILGS